jgi:pyruvate dehydrogenase E2 component (dihydrolipoamide acetyltransferase)
MSESVNLPALGESVTEGTVTRWLKKVGDRVEVDEPLLEVSTDKVDTEIPSPIAGVIESILVAEDETVEVGTPLVTIAPEAAAPSAPTGAPAEPTAAAAPVAPAAAPAAPPAALPTTPPAAPATPPAATIPASPYVAPEMGVSDAQTPPGPVETIAPVPPPAKEPAAQEEVREPFTAEPALAFAPAPEPAAAVDLANASAPTAVQEPEAAAATPAETPPAAPPAAAPTLPVEPAGANAGYVTPLVRKLANEKGVDLASVAGTGVGGRIRKQDVLTATDTAAPAASIPTVAPVAPLAVSPLRGTTVPLSRLRKVIAERAVISMQTSAQLTSVVEADVTLIASLRDSVKAQFQAKTGLKLTFLPFFVFAATEALKAYPVVNASIEGDAIVYPDRENISIAVDTDRGLLTPVIRDAGSLDIAGIARQVADLAERTRDNKLKPDELAGGTFTVTNTGSRGALFDTPIVFLPQSAILGTGIVTKKPVVVSDQGLDAIAVRSTVYLALSYDHRIVDGADAARFLVAVKNRLESGDFAASLGI